MTPLDDKEGPFGEDEVEAVANDLNSNDENEENEDANSDTEESG